MVIAVTESNNIYALNATTGTVIWQRNIGTPAPTGACPGNISPNGITGTPVVDLASRSLFFDSVINGNPIKHFIYSLTWTLVPRIRLAGGCERYGQLQRHDFDP